MAKRKKQARRRRKSTKKPLKYPILTLLIVLVSSISLLLGYYLYELGFERGIKEASSKSSLAPVKKKEREALEKILQKPSEVADYKANEEKHASSSRQSSSSQSSKTARNKPKKTKKRATATSMKPKLAIIIDDVSFLWQVRALKALHMPLNLSFFPPSSRHPNTPRYARTLRHYMIHLPMEATSFRHEEVDTLRTTSSMKYMDGVIRKLRKKFPRAKFVNNHTGSRFTSDYDAMVRLVKVLDRYGFRFVDSRTTPKTQVPALMKKLGRRYLARDIFLDNELDVGYIKGQIQKAVKKARRKGFAIDIGHPHSATIKALRESKSILKDVELIYMDNLQL